MHTDRQSDKSLRISNWTIAFYIAPLQNKRWLFYLIGVLFSQLLSQTLLAQEPTIRSLKDAIHIQPGASCLKREKLAEIVEGFLQKNAIDGRIQVDVKGDPKNPQVINFTIRRANQPYAMRFFDDAPADCNQRHELLALSIAFAIDATWLSDRVLEQKPSKPKGLRRIQLGGDFLVTRGLVPGIGFGAEFRFGFGVTQWLDLRASHLILFSLGEPLGESLGTVDSLLTAIRLDACSGGLLVEGLHLRVCMGWASGIFATTGRDMQVNQSEVRPWFAGVSALEVQVGLVDTLQLLFGGDVYFPILRRVIQVLGPNDEVVASNRIDRVAVVGRTGLMWFFP